MKAYKGILKLALFIFLFSLSFFCIAQIKEPQSCDDCSVNNDFCQGVDQKECLKVLEKCVNLCEARIKEVEEKIGALGAKEKGLTKEIETLKAKIEKLNSEIKKVNLYLAQTKIGIKKTEDSLQETEKSIQEKKEKIAQILRTIDKVEKKSLAAILLEEEKISGFFDNLYFLKVLNKKIFNLHQILSGLKGDLEQKKAVLEKEKEKSENLLKMQLLQKVETENLQKEKNEILKMTKAKAQEYLSEKESLQKKAAEIRKRIFQLVGISKAPTFGEAYEVAKWVQKITGIRPAFLLAVLKQESDLGRNVGQCYLKNIQTGAGIRISTGEQVERVMAPGPPYSSRNDVALFLNITKSLGRDSFSTPVSCPMSYGWGGAMGPAQFIPTTWENYKPRLSSILGRTPDPWRVEDAFLAAGLYLADYGATSRPGEYNAALMYFSGTTDPAYSWYANSILAIANGFEKDIEVLEKAK
jgi:peptidoglycan hydrolase CwlO-like protein